MAVQPTADFWSQLKGARLGGTHDLREWIGDDGTHRYFLTNPVEAASHGAVVAVVVGDSQQLEDKLRQWNNAGKFDHPHLVRVYEAGADVVDDQPLVYAVMEQPEEDLGSVTLGRALTVEETTAVARALIAGLRYLHENGFAHCKVDPFSIVAIGSAIKLISHDTKPATRDSVAGDIRAFGFTMCQLLTSKRGDVRRPEDLLLSTRTLPAPFDEIVRGCTQRSWSLNQVERRLDGLPVEEAAPPPVVSPMREPELPLEAPSPPNRLMWVAGAAAAGLFAAILFLATSRDAPSKQPNPTPPPVQPAVSTVVSSSSPAPTPPPPIVRPNEPTDWRVIAYTYTLRKDAEERVRRIRTRWPQLRPDVFSPRGNSGPHLVALGGTMTRAEAQRMRSKALSNGLPSDTFARNFK